MRFLLDNNLSPALRGRGRHIDGRRSLLGRRRVVT
jgi:hypothetical protein